ncbi:MAG: hypothetical protein R6X19_05980 [Kiritimatiellia bacterium]
MASNPKAEPFDASKLPKGDTRGFVRDRFGMFIHWGLCRLTWNPEPRRLYCLADKVEYAQLSPSP